MSPRIKSFHAISPARQQIWRALRIFLPAKTRFFFEGSMDVRGQLWYRERKLLYQAILKRKPHTVFEVGTWEGGGSTLFIAQALHDVGKGILHTVETDPARYTKAADAYNRYLPHLVPFVSFHQGAGLKVLARLLDSGEVPDAVFLDGAQDPVEALAEFQLIEPCLRPGSLLMLHDWDNEKMTLVRKGIEVSEEWRIVRTLGHPHSVGLALVEKLGGPQSGSRG